jgi:hypothetical protein
MKKHTLLKKEALHVMINLAEVFHGIIVAIRIKLRQLSTQFYLLKSFLSDNRNATCLKRIEKLYLDHANDLMKDSDPIIVLQTSQLKDLLKRGA